MYNMKLAAALTGLCLVFLHGTVAAFELSVDEFDESNVSKNLRGLKSTSIYPPPGYMLDPIFMKTNNCTLTCAPCPVGCTQIMCTDKPVYIPPRNPMFPPDSVLHRSLLPFSQYPIHIPRNSTAEIEWFNKTYLSQYPKAIKQANTTYALSAREKTLLKMTLSEWMEARAADKYTCVEMATASVKRALYLEKVQKMGQFMYFNTFDWIKVVMKQARRFDTKAKKHGTRKISPMYCYPIPIKGTISTKDFPASNGWPALYPFHAKEDADVVKLLKAANAVQFGLTTIPPIAAGGPGWLWESALSLNPWGTDDPTAGSSAGAGSAVASNIVAIAITEDTGGSTNGPATRQHNFGYDPPKFHYPNDGNPSLTVRNDQIGVNARTIEDIIAYDKALLGTEVAHAKAAAYVAGLSNKDIKIGCSNVHYNYTRMSPSKARKYNQSVAILKAAGFTFVDSCMNVNPYSTVKRPYSNSITFDELTKHIRVTLGLNLTTHEVLLNGYYGLSRGWNTARAPFADGKGCSTWNVNQTVIDDYLGRVPTEMSNVYNTYFDSYGVDLMIGPTEYCSTVSYLDDMKGTCDGGNPDFVPGSTTSCYSICHSVGVTGSADKMFTKAKFVVPIGLTDNGEKFSLQFMSRAGPRNPTVPASEWVLDQEGPKTWNLEELYMIKRIYNVLAAAGLKRADAPLNFIDGFFD